MAKQMLPGGLTDDLPLPPRPGATGTWSTATFELQGLPGDPIPLQGLPGDPIPLQGLPGDPIPDLFF